MTEAIVGSSELFERFAPFIVALPNRERLKKSDLLVPEFRLHQDGQVNVYYAPLDYLNEGAKVMLLGITPGWEQMEIAYRYARQHLLDGFSMTEAIFQAKKQASFAGLMRKNLVAMLDGLELASLLGIPSTDSLFGEHRFLLHTSSVIRYPVFTGECNYTGHRPRILSTPVLSWFVDNVLAAELQAVSPAAIIPLGKSVSTILEYLTKKGVIERKRCLLGFPHPSGANGHRVLQFDERRGRLAQQLKAQLS